MDTRWLELLDERGVGIRAKLVHRSDESGGRGQLRFNWSASHYTAGALDTAKHPCDLIKEDAVFLRLDVPTAGCRTGACGPRTLPEFEVECEVRAWEFMLEAVNA